MKNFALRLSTPYWQLGDFLLARAVLSVPVAVAALALALVMRRPPAWWLAGAAIAMALSNLPLRLWATRLRRQLVVWPAALLDLAFALFLVHATGGVWGAATLFLIWPVLAVVLLCGPGSGYLMASIAGVLYAGLALLEQRVLPPLDLPATYDLSLRTEWGSVGMTALALLLLAFVLGLLTSGISLTRTRLAEALDVERNRLSAQEEVNRRLVVLEETGAILSRLQDLEFLLPRALEKLTSYIGADAGFIILYPPDVLEGVLSARLGLDENGCRQLLAGELPVQVESIERATLSPSTPGFQSYLAAPLRLSDDYLGTVYLLSRPGRQLQRGAEELLDALGGQLAIAVRNVQFTQQLKAANEELLHVDQLKSDFLATMSHELRTPLTSVVGYTDMLLSGLAGDVSDKQKTLLRSVLNSSETLLNLINDLLDLTKIEAGKMDLSLEPVELKRVVAEVLSVVGPKAQEKGIRLSSFIPAGLPPLLADASKAEQILVNLVSNAVKFTPELGSVTIEGRPLPTGFVEIRVADTGIGIAREDFARIFERFSQVDNTSTRSQGGTGLGLAITRDLIELHGGTITVQSQVGKGSVFIFTIPQALTSRSPGPSEHEGRGR